MISVVEPSPSDESLGFLSNESRSAIVNSTGMYWLTELGRRRSWPNEWTPPPLDYGPMRRNRAQAPEISMAAGGSFIENMIDTVNTLFPVHVDDRSAPHFWIESDLLALLDCVCQQYLAQDGNLAPVTLSGFHGAYSVEIGISHRQDEDELDVVDLLSLELLHPQKDQPVPNPTATERDTAGELKPGLIPVDEVTGAGAEQLRRVLEPLLAEAFELLQSGAIDDPLHADMMRTNADWLRIQVMLSDLKTGIASAAVAPIFVELAALIHAHSPASNDELTNALADGLVEATSTHPHDDPEIVEAVAKAVETATQGRITRRNVKWAIAAGTVPAGMISLIADIGLKAAIGTATSFVAAGLLTLTALTWRRPSIADER